MTSLLRIDSSSRLEGSFSRRFGDEVEAGLSAQTVIRRDLATHPLPHLSAATIQAFFSDPATHNEQDKKAVALSESLIRELESADTLLLTLPMYNFSVPSALKAWIDHVVRMNRTFSYDGKQFSGLLSGKNAIIITAYGAAGYTDGAMASADFATSYLRFILNVIGITDIQEIPIEGLAGEPDAQTQALEQARAHWEKLTATA